MNTQKQGKHLDVPPERQEGYHEKSGACRSVYLMPLHFVARTFSVAGMAAPTNPVPNANTMTSMRFITTSETGTSQNATIAVRMKKPPINISSRGDVSLRTSSVLPRVRRFSAGVCHSAGNCDIHGEEPCLSCGEIPPGSLPQSIGHYCGKELATSLSNAPTLTASQNTRKRAPSYDPLLHTLHNLDSREQSCAWFVLLLD
jgi:hypothetical protein